MPSIGGVVAMAAAGVVLTACLAGDDRPASSPPSATQDEPAAAAGQCPPAAAGTVDADSVLVPGPGNGVPRSPAPGDPLVIVALVLDDECLPAAGASINLWHTDAKGAYGPAEEECCYFQGTVRTDREGRFRLETIRPGRYAGTNAPPAHIHLEVRHQAGSLNSEFVFVGDPGVPTAPVDGYSPVALRETGTGDRSWYGEATLVLQP
ncbi:MAG: hypothetical protein ACRDWY_05470 [Actinomycetes bacterium]